MKRPIRIVTLVLSVSLLFYLISFWGNGISTKNSDWAGFASYMSFVVAVCSLGIFIYLTTQIHNYNINTDRPIISFITYENDAYYICNVGKGAAINCRLSYHLNNDSTWKKIFTKRKKTDTLSRIPLLPIAIGLLTKYSNHPTAVSKGKLFPPISNQKLNSYLKEISVICGINKDLTFHCARHTFATTVTLTNGVPIETVSKMLGHRSLRTTQLYAKILDSKISEDMKELKKKLIQPN